MPGWRLSLPCSVFSLLSHHLHAASQLSHSLFLSHSHSQSQSRTFLTFHSHLFSLTVCSLCSRSLSLAALSTSLLALYFLSASLYFSLVLSVLLYDPPTLSDYPDPIHTTTFSLSWHYSLYILSISSLRNIDISI